MIAGLMASGGTALLGRLAASGLQRVGSLVFQKICRTLRIEQALRGNIARNPNVKKCIDDFEVVVSSRYGELTEKLDLFLRELERTGLVNLIVESAILGQQQCPELEKSFVILHSKTFENGEGDPKELFAKLQKSFAVTVSELTKDRVLFDAMQLHQKDMQIRFERLQEALATLNAAPRSGKSKLTPEQFSALLLKVARGLQNSYRTIRVETNKGARSVEITRMYVPSSLRYRDTPKNDLRLKAVEGLIKTRLSESTVVLAGDDRARMDVGLVTYPDLKLQFRRAAILGDPGGGKSTLCQHLCFDLSKQAVAAMQVATPDKITAQLQKFPIRVIIRNYEKAKTSEPQLTLYDYILRDWANHVAAGPDELRIALDYLLTTGSAVLAFDGLDEILVTARRREFVDLVLAFCTQYPLCPALVTSRVVGYDDAPLTDEWDELILEKFNDNEVREYAKKFFRVVGGHSARESEILAGTFFQQTTQNASDLRRNPLMLGLMTWIFNIRRDVPSNRPEIYRECAILMFERWDPDRDIKADIPSDFDRLHLFSYLASTIYGHPELSAGVELDWLEATTKKFFERVYENRARAIQSAKALVKFITGRAWVMSEIGDRIFAFTHQTFLEYFFAKHLEELHDTVPELYAVVFSKLANREWDMVAHLALQIKTYRNLRRQNELLDILRTSITEETNKKKRAAITSFAARALEYLAGSEANIKGLITVIFDEAVSDPDGKIREKLLAECCECSMERRVYVYNAIADLLVSKFKSNPEVVTGLLYLDGFGYSPHLETLPPTIVVQVRSQLESHIRERVQTRAVIAQKAWEWYGLISPALVSKFGIQLYYNARLSPGIGSVDGLSATVLCASKRYHRHYSEGPLTKKTAADALAIFGQVTLPRLPVEFTRQQVRLGHMPLSVWRDALEDYKNQPSVLIGIYTAMLIVTETEPPVQAGHSKERRKIINRVLRNPAIQNHKLLPLIQEAATKQAANVSD